MKVTPSIIGLLIAVILVLPSTGHAQQQAFAAKSAHVRAGPAKDYPVVEILAPGTPLTVEGCLSSYTWCDVILPDYNRGWIYAGNLDYDYNGAYVPVLDYGSSLGLEIVSFSLGIYWDTYYRGHPWYRDRQHWIDNPIHPRPQSVPRPDHFGPPAGQAPVVHAPAAGHAPDHPHPGPHPGAPAAPPAAHSPGVGRGASSSSRGRSNR